MKRFKQFLTVFLAIVMCVTTVVPVHAATPVTQDGITLTVTPDKTTYSQEETITATVKVENTNDFAVTDVSLEGITPEGYELKVGEGDSLTIGELAAGASKELAVSFVPKTTSGEEEDVVIYYKENFEYEGNKADYFVEQNTDPQGIYVPTVANASTSAVTDGTDKALNIIGSSAAGSGTFRTDARWSNATTWSDSTSVSDLSSKHVVYEFDLKLQGTSGNNLVVQLRSVTASGSGVFSTILKIDNNVLYDGLTPLTSLSLDTDYHIAIVCDFATKTRDIYLNGTCISGADDLPMANADSFNSAKVNDCIRFSCWKALDTDIVIDNLAVYESDKPVDIPFDEEGAENVVIHYAEDFEYEGNKADYFVKTNGDPIGIYVPTIANASTTAVTDGTDKALNIIGSSAAGSGTFRTDARWSRETSWNDSTSVTDFSSKHVVYELDLKLQGTAGNNLVMQLRSVSTSGSGVFSTILKLENNVLYDGLTPLTSLSLDTDYHIAIVCDYATKTRDIYLNGTCISGNEGLPMANADSFNSAKVNDCLRFSCWKALDTDIIIDNLAVYESDKPVDIPFDAEIGGGTFEIAEGEKIYATDLELSNPFTVAAHDNIIEWIDEPGNEENKVLRFERKNANDFYIDLVGINTDATSVVYDFGVKLLNAAETLVGVQLIDDNANHSQACNITEGGIICDATGQQLTTAALKDNEWNNIAVVYNYAKGEQSIYVNGALVKEKIAIDPSFGDPDIAGILRFSCPTLDETAEGFDINNHNAEFMIDNVRVYKGTKPCEELISTEGVITIDPNKIVFEDAGYNGKYSTSTFEALLTGYMSLHTRNGMVYKDGIKTKLATMPVETESGFLVVATEICEALGITCTVNGDTVKINNKQADVVSKDGKLWIDAQYFFETILGKVVSIDETAKSDGMMIAGAGAFPWPTVVYNPESVISMRTGLQNLNDYLFFERPTPETLQTLYKSSDLYGVHPRIQTTAEDIARIKEEIKSDSLKSTWYQQLITAADYLVEENTEALRYELRDGERLLYVSRDMLDHMYTLGMAYLLTGEQKYVDRAWVDLYAVSTFKDWHPVVGLDTSEMSAAVAIGYDWLYHGLSEVQRERIEAGIYKNGFYEATKAYQDRTSYLAGGALSGLNLNSVYNGGLALSAIALMDKYPEESFFILSGAIRAIDIMLTEYGPDGAWKEGTDYWEYATQYAIKLLSGVETIFGTCFSLELCEGLSTTANFILYMQSDQGIFNYGDAMASSSYVPELFYLSNKYNDKAITSSLLELNHGKMTDNEDVVLSLLWYDTSIKEGSVSMPLDGVYWTEGVASFRDAWTDGVTAYAAIHGGYTLGCHTQIDGGTFVYDYAGVRWAKELGLTPYNTEATSDMGVDGRRWLLYRARAESQNTIVINPDNSAGQLVDSTAWLTRFESDNKGGIAVLDMSENYAQNASKAIRGFFFTDDRTSLVVRDEISLSKDDSIIYWFMQTDADVEIAADGKSATLTQAGQQVTLEFVTSGTVGEATLSVGPSVRMTEYSTSPITGGTTSSNSDVEDPNVNRIAIKLTGANGDVAITTKLTPADVKSTSVEDYNVSISTWEVPEGEIASKPEVQSVVIEGREIKFDSSNQATFLCVEGKYESAPTASVTVDETKYTYEVTGADSTDGGTITIIVRDKNDANVYTTYKVNMAEIPVAAVPNEDRFAGMTALQVIAAEASAEPEASQGRVAWKVLDQNPSSFSSDSHWVSQGIGNWILLELEEEATVDNLIIYFVRGHVRSTYFNVSVSTDGVNYEQVYAGKSGGTAIGSKEAYEQFALGGKTAKYIKIGCNGNSADGMAIGFNSIGEIVFTGTVVEPTPTPTPGTDATPTPTPGTDATPTPGPSTTPTPSTTPDADDSVDVTIVSESTNTSYTKSSTNKVTIYCTGEHTELVGVDMDGKEVDSSNYTVTKGSTIVEFKNEYLETLTVGEHTVTLRYTEARSVNSKVTIIEKTSSDTEKKPEVEDDYSDNNEASNSAEDATTATDVSGQAVTGDNSNPLLWSIVSLLAISGAVTLSVIYRKRFKGMLSMLLVCVLLAGMVPSALNVHAEGTATNNTKTLTATDSVTVGESSVSVGFKLTYTLPEEEPSAPVITIGTQPTAAEVKVGEKATLTVAATATENAVVTYQWYSCEDANKTNASAVSGATSATYEVTPAAVGTVYYYCVVSAEGATSVESSVVAVTASAEESNTPVVYYEQDFADETAGYLFTYGGNPKGVYKQSGNADPEKVSGDNKLSVTSSGENYRVEVRWSDKTAWSDAESCRDLSGKTVVYEFELTPNGDVDGTPGISKLYVILRSQNGGTSTFCTVENNVLKFNGVTDTTTLVNGTSYKIKVVYKYGQGIRDIYVNEDCVATNNVIPSSSFQPSGVNDLIRFYQTAAVDFYIDDIRVYESLAD